MKLQNKKNKKKDNHNWKYNEQDLKINTNRSEKTQINPQKKKNIIGLIRLEEGGEVGEIKKKK